MIPIGATAHVRTIRADERARPDGRLGRPRGFTARGSRAPRA